MEIDPFFLKKLGMEKNEKDILSKKTLTFIMDQSAGTSDYLIPFYIKNKNEISKKSWADMNSIITFSAEQQS